MRWIVRRRPSPSIVISLIALVVAMSGSAMAASTLISGDKLIRKHSLSGNRLRNHTLTGRQINLAALGTVPNASHATTADTANHVSSTDTATNATHAATADNATNADHASAADSATNANHATAADRATNASHADSADAATNATNATNADHAANADNADHAANADNATNATNAGTALNADNLGGFPPSSYQLACKKGAVAAGVYIKGSATFSSTYTSGGTQDAFDCTGGVVEVKRTATGVYDVHFGGLDSGGQLLAVGNQSVDPNGVQVNGGELSFKLIFDASVNGGAGGTVYQVRLDDAGGITVDNEFSFALLSPQ